MSEQMFKAYDNKNKRWLESFVVTPDGKVIIKIKQEGWQNFKEVVVVDATLCRSTGLRDSKRTEEFPEGEMIFEGDIIKGHYGATRSFKVGVVYWNNEYLGWYHYGPLHCFDQNIRDSHTREIIKRVFYDAEVIGNIFNNSELLEAKK